MPLLEDIILEVRCPTDVYETLRAAGYDQATLSQEARQGLAVRLYGAHRLSLGKAAELAGMPLVAFMGTLRELGLPVCTYGQDEYAEDNKTIASLAPGAPPAR